MPTIDNLSIEVTASADRASRVFDRLASNADRLRGAARGAAGGMQDMAQGAKDAGTETQKAGTQAGQAQSRFRGTGNAAKDAGDKAKKGASGIKVFWESLKRIAFYRFVRSIIREITDAFKTGITNLYQWSSAVNGTFAKSMDRIATSTLYLKNSLGAMLAPLINTLAPVIEWIIDRIVDVINWINKLFAALSGSQTYTVAKKVATTWGDAGKTAAGSAKKAADDIKRTILGFDEINKLSKENTGSYGGGSGSASSGPNYTDMFEERRLDGWMSKLAAFIDKFNMQIPAVFGALLAGWAAVSLAIKGVAALTSGWLGELAGSVISIGVTLFRKGWSTLLNWVTSFGPATVPVAVTIGVTALALWLAFKVDWAAVRDKVLDVGAKIATSASELWLNLQLGWNTLKTKALNVGVQIVTRAAELWLGLQLGWALLRNRVLNVSAKIATSAAELWLGLQLAWSTLSNKALNVAAKIATTASDLWLGVQLAWSKLGEKALGVKVQIATAASDLFASFKKAWDELPDRIVSVGVSLFSSGWKSITEWLKELKGSFIEWRQGMLFKVGVSLHSEKWTSIAEWFKEHSGDILKWTGITAATIGIGVAITTGAPVLAAALGDLWTKVIALIGGALPIVIAPAMAESEDPYYTSGSQYTQEWYDTHIAPLERMAEDTTIDIPINPDTAWGEINNFWDYLGLVDLATDVWFNAKTAWDSLTYGIYEYIGADDLHSILAITTETVWQHFGKSIIDYLGLGNLKTTVKVGLSVDSSRSRVGLTGGAGGSWRLMTQALGGIFSNGIWSSIPQFANGTLNAGSIFAAGEAGPELVGHIGGRTEVLNRSQIASAIYSAVQAAMAPASANFAQAAAYMSNRTDDSTVETMAEMIKIGVEQAMERERDILRQQLETLRQINAKDFSANISTSDINKAQTRANRRAGTTIVPVG